MLTVPYCGPLERPVTNWGLVVRITGESPTTARRFNINFQCGPSLNPRDDVAFHLAADFDGQCVIANSILGNRWGPQEVHNEKLQSIRGSQFVIDVLCEQPAFQVSLNYNRILRFEHRIEPSRITHLAIDGDIILHKIEYIGGPQAVGPIGFSVPPSFTHNPPYPSATLPPYPAVAPPVGGYPQPHLSQQGYVSPRCPSPNPTTYPQQPGGYAQQPGPYPQQPGSYPQQPGSYPQQPGSYPQQPGSYPQQHGLYPQQPGMHSQHGGHSPNTQHKQKGLLDKIGLGGAAATGGVLGTVATGAAGLYGLKHMKKQAKISKKAQKKALKYGLPIAGVGLGAYALHKTKFGFGSSSSSSSSSDSD